MSTDSLEVYKIVLQRIRIFSKKIGEIWRRFERDMIKVVKRPSLNT
jgi:hypothetical protein